MNKFDIRVIVSTNEEEHSNRLVFKTDDFIEWVYELKNVEIMRENANALLRTIYHTVHGGDHSTNLDWYFE